MSMQTQPASERTIEHQMLVDLVVRFVRQELLPLEPTVLRRVTETGVLSLSSEERARLDERARELGLAGLDAPEEFGGFDMPAQVMVDVFEEFGRTVVPNELPPDSPNLRMLMETVNDDQRERYLGPYSRGETKSAIAVSEPGAGSDPSVMTTRATREGDEWVLNGRKLWTSRAEYADWTIVMAVTDREKGARGGISAFIVDKGTPGFIIERLIPMIGGKVTAEILLDNCRIPASQLLGEEGKGFAPMQGRLSSRRLQMAAWCVGRTERALQMLCEHASQRRTFGELLAKRQSIQWWIADAATRVHACRLMIRDAAARVDRGDQARTQVSMVKVFATDMAWQVLDNVMQAFGAMGMTRELPLQQMANEARLMRIYEGPTEVHQWLIARNVLSQYGPLAG